MTKQVDILLSDTKSIEKKSTTITSSKKEGASFFDSMLSSTKVKPSETSVEQKALTKNIKNTESQVNAKSTTTNNQEAVLNKKKKLETNPEIKNTNKNKSTNTEVKEDISSSSSKKKVSLLDRMLMEANNVLKDSKKEIVSSSQSSVLEKKEIKNNVVDNKESKKQSTKMEKLINNINSIDELGIKKEEKESIKKEPNTIKEQSTDVKETSSENKTEKNSIKNNLKKELKIGSESKDNKSQAIDNKESISDIKTAIIEKGIETKKEDHSIDIKVERKEDEANISVKEIKNELQHIVSKETSLEEKDNFKRKINISGPIKNKEEVIVSKRNTNEFEESDIIKNVKNNKIEENVNQNSKKTDNLVKSAPSIVENKRDNISENIKTLETTVSKGEGTSKDTEHTKKSVLTQNKENTIGQQTPTKNKKHASELAQLKTQPSEVSVNISKESLNEDKPQVKESLLDKLINETKKTIGNEKNQNITTNHSSAESIKEPSNDILTNIYLSQRNKKIEDKSLEAHNKGKDQALKAKSVEDVKLSAKTLELGLKSANVEVKQNSENSLSSETTLEKISSVKNNIPEDIQETDLKSKTVSKEASKAVLGETIVNLNVNAQNANIITQKIIGARQQMASMMSDIAREMYTNYKPPVTAFRLNLQPAHLGNIAIMIKSDKENSISISMNMSSSATLDAVNENQSSLRSALSKTFGDENSFNLDFGMQDENKNNQEQQGSNNQEQNNQRKKQSTSTEGVLEARNSNKDETLINYM